MKTLNKQINGLDVAESGLDGNENNQMMEKCMRKELELNDKAEVEGGCESINMMEDFEDEAERVYFRSFRVGRESSLALLGLEDDESKSKQIKTPSDKAIDALGNQIKQNALDDLHNKDTIDKIRSQVILQMKTFLMSLPIVISIDLSALDHDKENPYYKLVNEANIDGITDNWIEHHRFDNYVPIQHMIKRITKLFIIKSIARYIKDIQCHPKMKRKKRLANKFITDLYSIADCINSYGDAVRKNRSTLPDEYFDFNLNSELKEIVREMCPEMDFMSPGDGEE